MEPIKEIMARQGLVPDSQNPGPPSSAPAGECLLCHGSGWRYPVVDGRTEYSKVVSCPCRAEEAARNKARAMLEYCRLPERAGDWTFETFKVTKDTREAYEAAIRLAEESPEIKWLTLLGDWDRGKSHLLFAICQRWIARGRPARYAYVPMMLKELKQAFDHKGEYDRLFNFFCNVPLLALDDLGVEKQTPWVNEELDTIVNMRYVKGLPLVITSNLMLHDIPPRISSRLQRESWCKLIDIQGKEHRLERKP